MRWLRRFITNWSLRIPSVSGLIKKANRAIEEAGMIRSASRVEDLMGQEIELQYSHLRQRMEEVLDLRRAELACYNPKAFESLRESHAGPVDSPAQFKERLWELELALEDRGWVREVTLANLEFSRLGVQQLIRICRIYAIKNPLIKRGSEIVPLYVFSRGLEIRSEDQAANDLIQSFLADNQKELGHVALAAKEQSIQTDGSLYFAMVQKPDGMKVMMIDPLEIMDVITDPDDSSVPRYFLRQWSRIEQEVNLSPENKTVWYPALNYEPTTKPKEIQGKPVNWEMPVLRVKIGCPANWRWGIPPLYASIDWSRAYKDFLEDWATVQRTLSRFALMIETKGGAGAIAAYNALLNTTFADAQGTQIERNPPPVTGSAHISGPDNKVMPFKSAGAQDSPEQSRRLLLMVAAAQGMPETFYGDASTGSLATAQSLDRPTELKFKDVQNRWTDTLIQILTYVLKASVNTPKGRMREAMAARGVKFSEVRILQMLPRVRINGVVWEAQKSTKQSDVNLIIKFPAVLEHDPSVMVDAWAHVATLGGRTGIPAGIVDRRTVAAGMLHEIGYEDVAELLDDIYGKPGTDYDPGDDVSDQRTQVPAESITQATGADLPALGISAPKLGKGMLSIPKPAPKPPAAPVKPGAPATPPAPAKERKRITEARKLRRSPKLKEAASSGDTEKAWIGGTCDVCIENSDAGFIDINDEFPSGDDEPPAHDNCGCELETRNPDEED